jgi:hypothetical protein
VLSQDSSSNANPGTAKIVNLGAFLVALSGGTSPLELGAINE